MPTRPSETPVDTGAAKNDSSGHWQYSLCSACMQGDCSTRLYAKDGVVTRIEGNPDSPLNKGKVCIQGIASIMTLYNPYRVTKPLKRTNPRKGPDIDPGFVEITWEEAIDTVVERLRKIKDEDPRKLAVWWGWGTPSQSLLMFSKVIDNAGNATPSAVFPAAFGTPNEENSRCLCAIHFASNLVHGAHPEAISDLQHCEYLINPGRTVGPNSGTSHGTRRVVEALDRGMKMVTLDPRCGPEGSKAHRWLPIRPQTELAFALAMIHVIFYELGTYDAWYLENRTNGPYLIGPDGLYFRDKATNKPLVWDTAAGMAKTFDDGSVRDYALEGEYLIDGAAVKPALQLIKEAMKDYTPEWAEQVTTVPADDIRDVTREFVEHAHIGSTIEIDGYEFPFRPVQFAGSGRGAVSQRNGTFFDLAGKIINMLVGAIEVPGGITGNRNPGPGPWVLQPDADGVVTPIMEAPGLPFKFPPDKAAFNEFYPHAHATPYILARSILDPKKYYQGYELDTMINCGANSIRSGMDKELLTEAFAKVPFMVNFAINYDEITMMSDIVFPELHYLEQRSARFYSVVHQNLDDSIRGLVMATGRNPVPPQDDTRRVDDVLMEISDRLGFNRGPEGINDYMNRSFKLAGDNKLDLNASYTIDDMIDRRVKQMFGEDTGFEKILADGPLFRFDPAGKKAHNYWHWPENKTRHPIYFSHLKMSGERLRKELEEHQVEVVGWPDQEEYFRFYSAIPFWIPVPDEKAPPDFDLYAINWKTNFMRHGINNTQENAWLNELRDADPYERYVWMNSATAAKRGIADGDRVQIESRWGTVEGTIKVTELIHPEVIGIPGCYGSATPRMNPEAKKGTHFNSLLGGQEDVAIDPLSGSIVISPKVRVTHAQGGRR
jgi:anaerobic selenocysteine-containing dehydrogenase